MNRDHYSFFRCLPLMMSISLAVACGEGPQGVETKAAPSVQPPAPSELANATYTGIGDEPVQLTDGRWEGEPFVEGGASRPTIGLVDEFLQVGDLDGDGVEESVVLLWSSSGGSGTFDYLAAMNRAGGTITNVGTAPLGDRVKVRAGRIVEGRVELDVVQAGPGDAACCPTQLATRVWQLGPEGLTESSPEITGTLSVALLEGSEWLLTDLGWSESAPETPRVSLTFAPDRIAGNSGCNEFFASIEESRDQPGELSIGEIGTTRKMCPEPIMAVEDRFLAQLGGVSQYSFLAGKLALSWQTEEAGGLMLFARLPRAETESEP